MKRLIISLMPLMFFIGCEDEDGAAAEDSLVGTWSFVATEYDTTCTGNGEVFFEGTMVFDDENVTVITELGFNSFCSGMDGSLVDDTTCAIYYGNITLSMLHEMCIEEGMTATDEGCTESMTNPYTFNESLYINNVETGYSAADCELEEGGIFSESDSSCTFTDTVDITIDGNTAVGMRFILTKTILSIVIVIYLF